jgi:hypothetical protein
MTFPFRTMTLRVLSTLICTTSLAACGGGGGGNANADSVQAGLVIAKGDTPSTAPVTSPFAPAKPVVPVAADTPVVATPVATDTPVTAVAVDSKTSSGGVVLVPVTPTAAVVPPVTTPIVYPAAPNSGTLAIVTDVRLQNTSTAAQSSVPVTFGQVFAAGHVNPTDAIVGRLEDNTLVTLQMDVKARHADGSVRHAIFSAIIPSLPANTTRTMSLAKNATLATAVPMLPTELLAAGFTASTSATIAGVKYSASADQLLKAGAKATWLAGAVANEWQVSAPLTTGDGVAHPHLTARFAVRYYSAVKKARVDVTIENNWAYEPNPQNFKYDAEVTVGGKSVLAKTDLNHLSHARWRKISWWGGDAPAVNTMLNTKYLIATRAVPNYDQTIGVSPTMLSGLATRYSAASFEPMGSGPWTPYMPMTGAHDDIGLLPSWSAAYVLSMDKRARDVTLGSGDQAGSFSAHYRDKKTDRPVSLKNYPYMTIMGNPGDTFNPTTKVREQFPYCGNCATPYSHDMSHQPSMAYLPYLVTGDYYYLEEMQFWAMWNVFSSNPNYRGFGKGWLSSEQVRGQAWGLRTLADAAYITPDDDVLKADFNYFLDNNLDWYNSTYSVNATANKLGVIVNGYAYSYNGNNGIAPWQDDFFTSAVGHVADLGYTKANTLLAWKSKFPIGRMTAPGACWIDAAIYSLVIRPSTTSPVFSTIAEAYTATRGADFMNLTCGAADMAAQLGAKINDMGQLSDYTMGYPSNMQPALAYSVDSGSASAKAAWKLFMSRSIKPDYSNGPQFSIIPR